MLVGVVGGCPHTHAHACTCMHAHTHVVNMIISCKCHTHLRVHVRACMCTCVGGTLSPPANQDISIPFEDLKSVETSPPMGRCMVWWVGGWVDGWGQVKSLKI